MNSLFSFLLAGLCLVLLSGEETPQVAAVAPASDRFDAEAFAQFPGDWDESPNTGTSASDVIPEPTTALLIGAIGFAVMLRRRS